MKEAADRREKEKKEKEEKRLAELRCAAWAGLLHGGKATDRCRGVRQEGCRLTLARVWNTFGCETVSASDGCRQCSVCGVVLQAHIESCLADMSVCDCCETL